LGQRKKHNIKQLSRKFSRLIEKPKARQQTPIHLPLEQAHVYKPLIKLFEKNSAAIPLAGNKVQFFYSGYEKLHALLKAIQNAQHHIHLQYYIFEDDNIGRQVQRALIEQAKHGIEIRVLYDDVGSWSTSKNFFEEMREAGIAVRAFMKVRFPGMASRINHRNHRKQAIIDGKIGFIGGMNLAQRYMDGGRHQYWRDTHMEIWGEAVHGLQTSFLIDWYTVDKSLLVHNDYFPDILEYTKSSEYINAPNTYSKSIIQIVASNPLQGIQEIHQGIVQMIHLATKQILLQTPYFLPSETLLNAIETASLSGVDVQLMLPQKGDSIITQYASQSYIEMLLDVGVKIWLYKDGFLHSKALTFDDSYATIGSTNLDYRSFDHNFEVNAIIYDVDLARELRLQFEKDIKHCSPLTAETWKTRSKKTQLKESIARLFSPLL
ncbi:MAG TPA: cardiolipin synthase, partial [Bacteroidaceae bacterium]|nr:cardiolipin synthase [Bacteroidaceae bacterium]